MIASAEDEVGKLESSHIPGGIVKWQSHFGKLFGYILKS